jgi:hypothetical protein
MAIDTLRLAAGFFIRRFSFHKGGQTFSPKILKIMIEDQARWSENDLKRLKMLK